MVKRGSSLNNDMTHSRLLEVARLRSLISRMVRIWGRDATLDMLRGVIESQLIKEPVE
jgi:hypothetical protein